eukprot:CAMPEP_0197065544 /NCGR_PEP_ID=MMETSP1384-20130603/167709_1 /TAXON_ID=29189 /ORGANISM="Ammonia sp." /LENGTH=48 /DNA_ID= /DNA_START= /DNA_END= /DNA_ORIENTATION=
MIWPRHIVIGDEGAFEGVGRVIVIVIVVAGAIGNEQNDKDAVMDHGQT